MVAIGNVNVSWGKARTGMAVPIQDPLQLTLSSQLAKLVWAHHTVSMRRHSGLGGRPLNLES
jgi:hypothetical protein